MGSSGSFRSIICQIDRHRCHFVNRHLAAETLDGHPRPATDRSPAHRRARLRRDAGPPARASRAARSTTASRKLEDSGTIVGYTVRLRPDIEHNEITAWMSIAVEGNQTRKVISILLGEPGVASLHDTNGRWDLLAELRCANLGRSGRRARAHPADQGHRQHRDQHPPAELQVRRRPICGRAPGRPSGVPSRRALASSRDLPQGPLEDFGRLAARDQVHVVDDDGGHRMDAALLVVAARRSRTSSREGVARENLARPGRVEAGASAVARTSTSCELGSWPSVK